MVLMTNPVKDIDDAIQSRISVALNYGPLRLDTRKTLWESFLKNATTAKGRAEYTTVDRFVVEPIGRRCVDRFPNMISTAHALVVNETVPLSRSHLEIVIDLDKEFQKDYNGARLMANKASYF
jgi:hypothetical protein